MSKPARIYDFTDYKSFVLTLLSSMPKGGRGQFAKLAEVAQTHKATISQIFRGEKHPTPEQAVRIAQYLELDAKETRYFVLLVNLERAGSMDLRRIYLDSIEYERKTQRELSERLPRSRDLTSEEKATFYSSWIYSAIRVLSSIDGFQSRPEIAKRLKLPAELASQLIEFLLQTGLCVETGGKLQPGPKSTFLESKSPLVARHHGNWRVKAMERHPVLSSDEELAYTATVSLSSDDVKKVREILAGAVERADQVVEPSTCERLFCLGIDWFEVL